MLLCYLVIRSVFFKNWVTFVNTLNKNRLEDRLLTALVACCLSHNTQQLTTLS